METINNTQAAILKHHGGDPAYAMQRITEGFERRHDETFWQFWNTHMAAHHQPGDHIIDLGAGIGQFVNACAARYTDSSVVGLEYAPYMLEAQLPLEQNAHILKDDLNAPNSALPVGCASMVMANMVVHELTQPIKMFVAAHQWLKSGGRMCVIDVVRQPLAHYLERRYPETQLSEERTTREDLEDAFEHFLEHNRYHPQDLEYMLTACGFSVVYSDLQRNGTQARIVVEKR